MIPEVSFSSAFEGFHYSKHLLHAANRTPLSQV